VAKITDSATNMTGSGIIGTPAYMSPEQAQGEQVDNRSDIYGLGVIIFQMLSGHMPYEATTPMGVAVKHITDPVPEILKITTGLPQQTDTIIKTAMAKDPSLRYQTATELATALSEAAFGKKAATQARTAMPQQASGSPKAAGGSRRGLLIGGAALLLLLLVGAGVVFGGRMLAPAATPSPLPPTLTPIVVTATLPPTAAATAGPALAPVCAPGVIPELITPEIGKATSFCNTGFSVSQFTIPLGASFSPVESGYFCDPYGKPGGKQLIACHGVNLTTFHVKVCIPVPTPSSSVVVGTCQQGTEYDYDHQCCAPAKPEDAGCTTVKVDLGTCQQ
jgi:hypothetical protein